MAIRTIKVKEVQVTDLEFFLITIIRTAMSKQEMTQRELAKRTKLTEKHISQMLQGYAGSIRSWDTLLDALNIKLGEN